MASDTRPDDVQTEVLDQATIRFAGDSGDGMQITGTQFTSTTAIFGNDLATFPDFPAEIRAPAGTIPGVSGFQVRFSRHDIHTPGDALDVLVAMNPAALKVNLPDLKPQGIIIVNSDAFNASDLKKAGYEVSPLDDSTLDGYRKIDIPLTTLTKETLKDSELDTKSVARCKNFFALGVIYWLFQRPLQNTIDWLDETFAKRKKRPDLASANQSVLHAGFNYADIASLFQVQYEVPKATLAPGTYRNIQGNAAVGLGLVAASSLSNLKLFLGSYPITPATDILHQLSAYKNYDVTTFQAEDEIAAMCATIGASYAGCLAVTTTSGPGVCLKSEAMGLAIMAELPMLIVDVQRGGPSTGLPTKTEQSDLLQVLYGRNGDSPIPVLACSSPADVFDTTLEACRIALKYMTPVVLLSDGYIANGSEPWKLPDVESMEKIEVNFATDPDTYAPYARDVETLARPWALPGTKGLQHRLGGLEKEDVTGNVSTDADNHERMTHLRAKKVAGIAQDIPPLEIDGAEDAKILVLGWGSTRGAITGAVQRLVAQGAAVAQGHLRHINPLPLGLAETLRSYDHVLLPEMNRGQLSLVIQGTLNVEVDSYTKITGKPFTTEQIVERVLQIVEQNS